MNVLLPFYQAGFKLELCVLKTNKKGSRSSLKVFYFR